MPRTLSSVAALGCLLLLPSAAAVAAAAIAVDADPIEAARDEASFFGRRLQFDVASLPDEEPVPVADGARFGAVEDEGDEEGERFGVAPAPIKDDGEDEGEGKKKHKRMKNHNKKTKREQQKTKRKHHHAHKKRAKGGKSATKAPSTSATMPPTVRAASKSSKKKRGKAGKGAKSGSVSMSMSTPHSGKAGKGEMSMTHSPTPVPTPAPSPETIAPTSVPDGAYYFTGFERGSLEDYFEWNSLGGPGGLNWEPTDTMPKDGVYAMQAPNLDNPNYVPGVSILELTTNPNWPTGKLYYSIVSGVEMPIDKVDVIVCSPGCGKRDEFTSNSDTYVERFVQLPPGGNLVSWFYLYNPEGKPPSQLPPDGALERSGVFIDNVYFVPDDVTPPPPTPPPSGPPTECVALDPNPYNFENPGFPEAPWSLSGAGEWFRERGDAVTGLHFMQSPVFDVSEASGTVMANATLQVCDDFTGGQVSWQVKTTALPPLDLLMIYVDGNPEAELVNIEEWQFRALTLEPGPHRIDFSYQYNPYNLPQSELPDRPLGVAMIDDVWLQSNPSATRG